ncbi:RNA polymerase sigma factor [Streptomyces sp. NPDC051018]|uniref:RNA polymerase sigma factor n=1 Tax=Streptomyces sp. NPDC051018 TaxID=3365639 RepID=UPI00378CFE1A
MLGDDAELTAAVLAAQDGDEGAFRTVYRAVHPRLLGYVRTLVGEPDAEDVASEAWLQIARDLERFSGDADRFRGWAARIARNRAFDHIRMRGRRPAVGGDETELNGRPAESDTADEAMEALATGSTMALIARLPQDQAEAVVLRVVVGLDAKTAAKTLGKRPGAVRTAAHRGLKRLAELLGADDSEGSSPPVSGEHRRDGRSRPENDGADGGSGGSGCAYPRPGAYGADGVRAEDGNGTGTPDGPGLADGADGSDRGAGPAGHGADLNGVPPQRGPGPGATTPAGVTHSRPRTQKDM